MTNNEKKTELDQRLQALLPCMEEENRFLGRMKVWLALFTNVISAGPHGSEKPREEWIGNEVAFGWHDRLVEFALSVRSMEKFKGQEILKNDTTLSFQDRRTQENLWFNYAREYERQGEETGREEIGVWLKTLDPKDIFWRNVTGDMIPQIFVDPTFLEKEAALKASQRERSLRITRPTGSHVDAVNAKLPPTHEI